MAKCFTLLPVKNIIQFGNQCMHLARGQAIQKMLLVLAKKQVDRGYVVMREHPPRIHKVKPGPRGEEFQGFDSSHLGTGWRWACFLRSPTVSIFNRHMPSRKELSLLRKCACFPDISRKTTKNSNQVGGRLPSTGGSHLHHSRTPLIANKSSG